MAVDLNYYTRQILRLLQQDARRSKRELAQTLKVSVHVIDESLKVIDSNGLILDYGVTVDKHAVGCPLEVLCSIKLNWTIPNALKSFIEFTYEIPYIVKTQAVTGEYDMLLTLYLPSFEQYQLQIYNELNNLDVVERVNTTVIMATAKNERLIPIDYNKGKYLD